MCQCFVVHQFFESNGWIGGFMLLVYSIILGRSKTSHCQKTRSKGRLSGRTVRVVACWHGDNFFSCHLCVKPVAFRVANVSPEWRTSGKMKQKQVMPSNILGGEFNFFSPLFGEASHFDLSKGTWSFGSLKEEDSDFGSKHQGVETTFQAWRIWFQDISRPLTEQFLRNFLAIYPSMNFEHWYADLEQRLGGWGVVMILDDGLGLNGRNSEIGRHTVGIESWGLEAQNEGVKSWKNSEKCRIRIPATFEWSLQ